MNNDTQTIIVDIDNEIAGLIEEINAAPNEGQQQNFVDSFQSMMIDQLIGPFGLTRAMFGDVDGGAITTVHNFEKGVVANEADRARHEGWKESQTQPFNRKPYEKDLPKERKEIFKNNEKIIDTFTNKELPKDGSATIDHTVSAYEVETSPKGHLAQTPEERVATANQKENKAMIDRRINSSKGARDGMEWGYDHNKQDRTKTNIDFYDINEDAFHAQHNKGRSAVDLAQDRAVREKQALELLVEGGAAAGKMAFRQILGLILKDIVSGLIADVRHLLWVGFEGTNAFLKLIKDRAEKTWSTIRNKWKDFLEDGVEAGLSGFMSTFLTLVINTFMTTAKNLVRFIREGVRSIIKAVKMIVSPPENATGADVAFEVMKILAGAVAVGVGIAMEEIIEKAILSIPVLAPLASELAPVIAGIITGALTLFTVLSFDRLRNHLEFRNKQLVDVHRGQTVSLLRINQTAFMFDAAYQNIANTNDAFLQLMADGDKERRSVNEGSNQKVEQYGRAVTDLDAILEQFSGK